MKFEYLPHTADIRMKIEGSTMEELFIAATLGMGNILKEDFCNRKNPIECTSKIEIEALDQTCLLIDFLSVILSLSNAEKSIYCKVDFLELTANKVRAIIHGTRIDGFDEEIKAVTYHEANVRKNQRNQWETVIIFDI
ncbi:MAG: archease [Maribacter sp.]